MRTFYLLGITPALLLVTWLVYATLGRNPSTERRIQRNEQALLASTNSEIRVAIVWPTLDRSDHFIQGVNLAVERLNEMGGPLGRKLRPVFFREEPGVAQRVAEDTRIVAAIGYSSSDSALRDVVSYNAEGIVLMLPFATDPNLTLKSFDYTFRTLPDDRVVAELAGQHCLMMALSRTNSTNSVISVVIAAARTEYGAEFARNFKKNSMSWRLLSTNRDIHTTNTMTMRIVRSFTYNAETTNFLPMVDKILENKFDMILVADALPRAGYLIRQLRSMGVEQPILGGDGLDSRELWNVASNNAFGVLFPSKWLWPPAHAILPSNALAPEFVRRHAAVSSHAPGLASAQGYEAIHLLAQAIERAGGSNPQLIAATLAHTDYWQGMLETYSAFNRGELAITNMFIKFLVSADYPTNLAGIREHVLRDMRAKPYTNTWRFGGFLSPIVTNRLAEVEEHVGLEEPEGMQEERIEEHTNL